MIEAIVDRDYVEVFGKYIPRPPSVAPSQWLEFWQPLDGGHQEQLDRTNGKKGHVSHR